MPWGEKIELVRNLTCSKIKASSADSFTHMMAFPQSKEDRSSKKLTWVIAGRKVCLLSSLLS